MTLEVIIPHNEDESRFKIDLRKMSKLSTRFSYHKMSALTVAQKFPDTPSSPSLSVVIVKKKKTHQNQNNIKESLRY